MFELTFKEEELFAHMLPHLKVGMPIQDQIITIVRITRESCENAAQKLNLSNYEIKPV